MRESTSTLSIDWEDFSQLCCKYEYNTVTEPTKGAIERQTNIMLDMLDETGCRATFFILGLLAKYRPDLVRQIAGRGHEIALHGQNHVAMFKLTKEEARTDIIESQKTVTDIIGAPVYGYRAPFFSVIKENLYLLETLAELGLLYDSSILPTGVSRYGISDFSEKNTLYALPGGKTIVELPMTTAPILGRRVPVCGGSYMRVLPSFLLNKIFRDLSEQKKDTMLYMHPYEFDTERIDVSANYPVKAVFSRSKTAALNFRWNLFRPSITRKLKILLNEHTFITCCEKASLIKNAGNAETILF